jgi:hypothetical protein
MRLGFLEFIDGEFQKLFVLQGPQFIAARGADY